MTKQIELDPYYHQLIRTSPVILFNVSYFEIKEFSKYHLVPLTTVRI